MLYLETTTRWHVHIIYDNKKTAHTAAWRNVQCVESTVKFSLSLLKSQSLSFVLSCICLIFLTHFHFDLFFWLLLFFFFFFNQISLKKNPCSYQIFKLAAFQLTIYFLERTELIVGICIVTIQVTLLWHLPSPLPLLPFTSPSTGSLYITLECLVLAM